jgi:hypothetical protein
VWEIDVRNCKRITPPRPGTGTTSQILFLRSAALTILFKALTTKENTRKSGKSKAK